jgi:hypothetical protein
VARGGDAAVRRVAGHTAGGAGIYSSGGALTLAGATIANNQAGGGRGGDSSGIIYHAGSGGSASGAGLYASGGALDISGSTIANNRAMGGRGGDGGSYFSTRSSITVLLGGAGGAAQGCGLYVNGGSLTVASSTIASNQGTGGPGGVNGVPGPSVGGGLYTSSGAGTPTVTGSTLSGNSASDGGGIFNDGTLAVSNSTLSGNNSAVGGGINNHTGTLTVSNSTLSGNSAGLAGGGISNVGTLTVSTSTLSGNSASAVNGWGGGIANSYPGTLTVSNSTLSGNSAYTYGGGICTYTFTASPVTLTNVTLTANRANTGGGSSHGGGLYVRESSGSPVLHNTLIAGNFRGTTGTTRDDVFGALNPGGDYNLIGDGTGMTGLSNGVNGNLVGTAAAPIDPLLGPLQDNGGPTQTMALLPGSPALNAGDPNQLGVADQRGVPRSGGVNIGAYQASATAFVLTAPDTAQPGVPFDVTVTAVDPFGQAAVGYRGTVTFHTGDPDPGVVLPADYPFTPEDGGTHTFAAGVTLVTPGDQTLTVTDTADDTVRGGAVVTVGGPAPGAGPHMPGRPPGGSPAGTAPARPPTRGEPSAQELAARERWWASSHEADDAWVRVSQMSEQTPGEPGAWWADLFGGEGRRGSVW